MKNLYGKETEKSLENFPFDYHLVHIELVYIIVKVKKAAAIANFQDSNMSKEICYAICEACDEVLDGKYDEQFITNALQGGAGTSINMNINEVIAGLASSKLEGISVRPNDDVNKSQSTNDVNPSGLKILIDNYLNQIVQEANLLVKSFKNKSIEFEKIKKLARTHFQDAVPTTIGEEFGSYSEVILNGVKK